MSDLEELNDLLEDEIMRLMDTKDERQLAQSSSFVGCDSSISIVFIRVSMILRYDCSRTWRGFLSVLSVIEVQALI